MPVLRREGSRPHRLRVHGYDRGAAGGLEPAWEQVVDLGAEDVTLPPAGLVVPNSTGDTFARVVLDDASRELVAGHLSSIPDEHPRVIVWATLLDEATRAELPVDALVVTVERHLPREPAAVAVEHVLDRAVALVHGLGVPEEVPALLDRLCAVALAVLSRPDAPDAVVQTATRATLTTSHDTGLLRHWLADGSGHGALTPAHRWAALLRLASLGEDVDELVEEELRRDPTSSARLAALSVRAARPEATAKDAALRDLLAEGTSNRELVALARGLWSPEQRDLVDPLVTAYLDRSRAVARRGQALALVVGMATPQFRWRAQQLAALEEVLRGPDLPPVLARTWADLLHDQRRTARNDPRGG